MKCTFVFFSSSFRPPLFSVYSEDFSTHCNTFACEEQHEVQPLTGVRTQDDADTLIMLHAAEIYKGGKNVHNMIHDTDVMVLALRRPAVLGLQATMPMGTGDNKRKILLRETNICPSWDIKSCSASGTSLFNRMWHMWAY